MRINFASKTLFDNEKVLPINPPPPIDLDELFELKVFRVSKTSVDPFEEIQIQWDIQINKEGTSFDDYHFSLVSTEINLIDDLEASGTVTFAPNKNTLLRIQGRKRGVGRNLLTLGSGIALTVDELDTIVIPLPARVIDYMAEDKLKEFTSSTASIRLKGEPTSNWSVFSIEYKFPLEIVINNFFNGDLDLKINIFFDVIHEAIGSTLDVTITHSSDVDFHLAEDIFSFGHTASIAKTIEKLLPLILDCKFKDIEKSIINELRQLIGTRSDTHRLLDVRIIVDGNFTRLEIVLSPLPAEQNPRPSFGDTTETIIL